MRVEKKKRTEDVVITTVNVDEKMKSGRKPQ
jgi:hypothetical protein